MNVGYLAKRAETEQYERCWKQGQSQLRREESVRRDGKRLGEDERWREVLLTGGRYC